MDFNKFFSWVPKDRPVKSKHEFHFIFFREPLDTSRFTATDEKGNVIEPIEILDPAEPNYLHWQDWFYSKIFCDSFWEEDEKGNFKTADYSNDKRQHIEDFLDFHLGEFRGRPIIFLDAIGRFLALSIHHKVSEVIPQSKYEDYKQMVQEWVLQKKKLLENKPKRELKKLPKLSAFQWQEGLTVQIPTLFILLKDRHKLIAPDSTLDQFTGIFTGVDIENSFPIKWLSTNRLLAYFLSQTFESQDWQSIAGTRKLFLNSRNKHLTANDLSVAKNEYENNGLPKGHEKIDSILKEIKNIKNIKTS